MIARLVVWTFAASILIGCSPATGDTPTPAVAQAAPAHPDDQFLLILRDSGLAFDRLGSFWDHLITGRMVCAYRPELSVADSARSLIGSGYSRVQAKTFVVAAVGTFCPETAAA